MVFIDPSIDLSNIAALRVSKSEEKMKISTEISPVHLIILVKDLGLRICESLFMSTLQGAQKFSAFLKSSLPMTCILNIIKK